MLNVPHCTQVSLFSNTTPNSIDVLVLSWYEFQNSIKLEIRICMRNCSQTDIATSSLHGTIITSSVTSTVQTNDLSQDVILQHDSGNPHSIHQTYCSHFTDNIMSIHHVVWPPKYRLAGHQFHNNVKVEMAVRERFHGSMVTGPSLQWSSFDPRLDFVGFLLSQWHWEKFFVKYSGFSPSLSFHQCSTLFRSPITDSIHI